MKGTRKEPVVIGQKITDLRRLVYSPDHNPLLNPTEITVKKRHVKTSGSRDLVDPSTGELHGVAAVYTIESRDDAGFVKVFADGVKAAFGLTRTAARVFQVVLGVYESSPMRGGYVESIYLAWFDGGLAGRDIGMSDRTFQNGLKELLQKGFLYPKAPNLFWVNPSLFFKGDRVAFIREYRRVEATRPPVQEVENDDQTDLFPSKN